MRQLTRQLITLLLVLLLVLFASQSVATTLYLRDTAASFTPLASASYGESFGNTVPGCKESSPPYDYTYKAASTTAGSSATSYTFTPRTRSAASDDPPCWFQDSSNNFLWWISPPLSSGVTLSGNIDHQIAGRESATGLNACQDMLILWWSSACSCIAKVIDDSSSVGELTTSLTNRTIAAHAPSGGSTTMIAGDRFIFIPRLQTGATTCGSGTFGGNGTRTADIGVNAGSGTAGHTFVNFADTLSFGSDSNAQGNRAFVIASAGGIKSELGVTTTTSATTTTTTLATWSDTFASIDSNWTQITWDDGTVGVSSGTLTSSSADSLIQRNSFNPDNGSSYACMEVVIPADTRQGGTYICASVNDGPLDADDDAICCFVDFNTTFINLEYFENGNYVNYVKQWARSSPAVENGDYIAVIRTGTDTWRCAWCDESATNCDAASDWTMCYNSASACDGTGSGDVSRTGITPDGQHGAGIWYQQTGNQITETNAGGGNGTTLPIPSTCVGQ